MKKKLAEVSKNCTSDVTLENLSLELIEVSALVRIAEALEIGVADYVKLRKDLEWHKAKGLKQADMLAVKDRQLAAQKGIVTKLRKQLAKQKP